MPLNNKRFFKIPFVRNLAGVIAFVQPLCPQATVTMKPLAGKVILFLCQFILSNFNTSPPGSI